IRYLAEQMIRLAGHRPDHDIAVVYSGLRPGEKLFEELFHEQENYSTTRHPKIMLAQPRALSPTLEASLRRMQQASLRFDQDELAGLLATLVPEYALRPGSTADVVVSISRAPQAS